jgi:hypothetical protein
VRIDKPRQNRLAVEIDLADFGTGQFRDFLSAACCQDAIARDGDRVHDMELRVDGDNLAVVEDQVRLLGRG